MLISAFDNVRRILAARMDNIGDLVMLSPALRELKRTFPTASLTLLTSPAGSQVAPMLPWVDEVITWRAVWQEIKTSFDQETDREYELVKILKAGNFDAAFIFTSFTQSPYPPAYVCYLAGIPVRVGQSKEFGGLLLTHWSKPGPDSDYQVDRNLSLLTAAGIPVVDNRMELVVPEQSRASAGSILREAGINEPTPFIFAAPGASAAARRYDPLRFANVVKGLAKETGFHVVVAGSAREESMLEPFQIAARKNDRIVPLIGKTTVPELAEIISRSSLVLTNNSASLHLAETFGRPMVVLYSGTEYLSQWSPRYAPARILNREVACSPCYAFQCPYQMQCLDISANEVIHQSLEFMAQQASLVSPFIQAGIQSTRKTQ